MKVYSALFSGHYPVGAAAVITAETKEEAEHLLLAELETRKLRQDAAPISVLEIDTNIKQAIILLDGDY